MLMALFVFEKYRDILQSAKIFAGLYILLHCRWGHLVLCRLLITARLLFI